MLRRLAAAVISTVVALECLAWTDAPAVAQGLLSAADKRTYKSAFQATKRNKWRQAHAIARRATDPLPRKILQWRDMTRRGTRQPFRRIAAFIRNNPDWPEQEVLLRRAEETMPASLAPAKVLKWFADRRPLTADGWIMLSRALLAVGRMEDAGKAARTTWANFNFGPKQQKVFFRGFARLLTPADHSARFNRLLWDGQYVQARRMWKLVSPAERALATARIRLRRSRPDVDGALAKVPDSLSDHPGLLYERLRWRRRRGRFAGVAEILEKVPTDSGRPDLWWEQREYVARELLTRGAFARAYALARPHGLLSGKLFSEAEIFLGWIALRFLNSRRAASAHFERAFAAAGEPVVRARAAYWAGRAAAARSEERSAADWFAKAAIYDASFYGQLADARNPNRKGQTYPGEPPPDGAKIVAFNRHELVKAIFMLNELGRRRLVRSFIDRLANLSDDPARQVLAGRLALAIKRPDLGIRVARHAYRTGNPFVVLGYPVIGLPKGGIEKGLVLSIALQESDFKPRARSRAGARGLMQIMPRTARNVSRRLKLRYSRRRLTNDHKYNLIIGRAYITELLQSYRGSYVLAVAAYNSGPSAVKRWLDAYGDPRSDAVDAVDWVEMIPFDETRNYVKRVLESLQVYRRRLGKKEPAYTLENDLENMLRR